MASDEIAQDLATWGREPTMNAMEAAMWRGERPPANATSGSVIEVLDRTPDWTRFREAIEWMVGLVPRLRERVVDPPLPTAMPVWAEDPTFDLEYHSRRVSLPGPGTHRDLLDFAQSVAVIPFDRSRPLWVGWLVEGLEGDRAAYVLQVHHCLFDGAAVIQLLTRLHSRSRTPRSDRTVKQQPALPQPDPLSLAIDSVRPRVPNPGALLRGVGGAALRNPKEHLGDVRRLATSIQRALVPPPGHATDLLQPGTRRNWRYATLECDLKMLKASAKKAGGTLNDAYVAALLGGLARYHALNGEHIDDIPMTMPVSTRRSGDPEGGNKFVAAFLAGPAGVKDPAERVRAVGAAVREVRKELTDGVDVMGSMLPIITRGPSALLAAAFNTMQNRSDLTASNVPGIPDDDVYFAGARVERAYFFGPLPGTSVMSVLLSHGKTCTIALTLSGDVISDLDAFTECLQQELDDVLAIAADSKDKETR